VFEKDKSNGLNAVTRIDVARRQISAAVHMFFRRHDPVVIHSVAAAASRTLAGLGMQNHRGADFFNKADWDSGGRISIDALPETNAGLLMDAILMLQKLQHKLPADMRVFQSWFVATHGDGHELTRKTIPHLRDNDVDPNDFDQIAALIAYFQITEDGPPES
jgi:hypothetical protein